MLPLCALTSTPPPLTAEAYSLAISATGRLDDASPRALLEERQRRQATGRPGALAGLTFEEEDGTEVPFLLPIVATPRPSGERPSPGGTSLLLRLDAAFDVEAGLLTPSRHLHEAPLLGIPRTEITSALQRMAPGHPFAVCDHPTECPLAVLLQRLRGNKRIHVTLTAATLEAPTSRRRAVPYEAHPFWAAALLLDLRHRHGPGAPITPQQVLQAAEHPLAAIPLPEPDAIRLFTPRNLPLAA